jgi:DNA-directed RNA polymerase specialized sigma24 family protein
MNGPGSVTVWLDRLQAGGHRDEAVARLWERYFTHLVARARNHLRGQRAAVDGEDVALSALDGFVRAVEAGRFPKLKDRNDLWAVLLHMTANRARNAVRDENRIKRGGGLRQHQLTAGDSDAAGVAPQALEPDPAEVVALAEEVEHMLTTLGNPVLQRVAVLALEGHTNQEIAAALGKAVATAERKLKRIREIWASAGYAPGET